MRSSRAREFRCPPGGTRCGGISRARAEARAYVRRLGSTDLPTKSFDDEIADSRADGEARCQARRVDSRRVHERRIRSVSPDHEVRERSCGARQRRPYAAAAQVQVPRLQVRKQLASGFEECLDWFPVILVIVFPLL